MIGFWIRGFATGIVVGYVTGWRDRAKIARYDSALNATKLEGEK